MSEKNTIRLYGDGRLVIKADHPNEDQNKIFMYKLSIQDRDYYVAVMNGSSVCINNVPETSFSVELI